MPVPLKNYPGYRITRSGEVWSCRSSQKIPKWARLSIARSRTWTSAGGKSRLFYDSVQLAHRTPGKRVRKNIHQLLLLSFIGPCPKGQEARHLDGDATNNRLSNLRWGTPQENLQDQIRHGTNDTPFRTARQVRTVHRLFRRGMSYPELARKYGISEKHIRRLLNGRGTAWSHLGLVSNRTLFPRT